MGGISALWGGVSSPGGEDLSNREVVSSLWGRFSPMGRGLDPMGGTHLHGGGLSHMGGSQPYGEGSQPRGGGLSPMEGISAIGGGLLPMGGVSAP